MKNLVITIPSKGRVFGDTLLLFKNIDIPVYVYVDSKEEAAYREKHPDYNIITHNETTIGAIRLFIQEHQASLNNDCIMLDDDCSGIYTYTDNFAVSINEFINEVKETIKQYDFLYFVNDNDNLRIDQSEIAVSGIYGYVPIRAVALSSNLYNNNVRYSSDLTSCEDLDFFVQVLLHSSYKLLEYRLTISMKYRSNFNAEIFNLTTLELYKKYGNIFKIRQIYDILNLDLDLEGLDDYKNNGVSYKNENKKYFENIILNKFPGWEKIREGMLSLE